MVSQHRKIKVFVILCCYLPAYLCSFCNPHQLTRIFGWRHERPTPLTIQLDEAWLNQQPAPKKIDPSALKIYRLGIIPVTGKDLAANPTREVKSLPAPTGTPSPMARPTAVVPTPSQTLLPTSTLTPTIENRPTSTQRPAAFNGRVYLSEILYDPAENDSGLEWVELFNEDTTIASLASLLIGDEETPGQGEGMLQFPKDAAIGGRATVIVAHNGEAFHRYYGMYPSFEIHDSLPEIPDMLRVWSWSGGSFALSNTADEVILMDETNRILDYIAWGTDHSGPYPGLPNVKPGHSLHRISGSFSQDLASNWFELDVPYPFQEVYVIIPSATPTETEAKSSSAKPTRTATATRIPTSTVTPSPTPTSTATFTWTPTPTETPTVTLTPLARSGKLLLSEVLINPPPGYDRNDHWLEIYNADTIPLDLSGYKIGDSERHGNSEAMFVFPPGAVIQPGQAVTISVRADSFFRLTGRYPDYEILATNSEIPDMLPYREWFSDPPQYVQLSLDPEKDELLLVDEMDEFVDAIAWGGSLFFSDPNSIVFHKPAAPVIPQGHSLERYPPNIDTHTCKDWRDQPIPSPGMLPP